MTKRIWLCGAAFVACALLLAAVPSPAADPKDDETPTAKDTAESDAVSNILMAYKLAEYGRKSDPPSPFALVTAAEILWKTKLIDAGKEGKDHITVPKAAAGVTPPAGEATDFLMEEAKKLLKEADEIAKANKQDTPLLKQSIERVEKIKRGGLNGPLVYQMALRPGQTDTYNVKFKKDEWARISIVNAGPSRLGIKVVNKNGDTRATDGGTNPSVAFIPHQKDGTDFTITVTNKGDQPVIYRLFTN